jgi:hypothetical protein
MKGLPGMPEELDQRKTFKELYGANARQPTLVDVPELTVIALGGVGDPAVSAEFRASVEALMTIAWGIRALRKTRQPSRVIKVMPLEGHWTLPGIPFSEDSAVRAQLQWSLQIVQPSDITLEELEEARAVAMKKKPALGRLADVRLEVVPAHRAATMLHVGPYTTEPETIGRIHEAITEEGGTPALDHREIYLSDQRRVAPGKLRTLLRVAMR